MKERAIRQSWQLHPRDFNQKKLYAKQDWRFQMFFEYLRISPSYQLALATEANKMLLGEQLCDLERANSVWKTRMDLGNVHEYLYKEWWLEKGLPLFGIHTQKPKVELIHRLSPLSDEDQLIDQANLKLNQFYQGNYTDQGRPDSVLISVPLGQKRTATVKQLKKLLAEIEKEEPAYLPVASYVVQNNKMQYRRLLSGLKLMYMRAMYPNEELWRIASRAKISHSHGRINPTDPKKDARNAEGRKILTIMASRLLRDTLIISENAATGVFPSLAPIDTRLFDPEILGARLKATLLWEKQRKSALTASQSPLKKEA